MIPLATTTITVRRPSGGDPTDAPSFDRVARGVRAVISAPSGSQNVVGGNQEVVDAALSCDPTAIERTDLIEDDTTGDTYAIVWARQRVALGLDHTTAGLRKVTGAAGA